MNVCAAYFSFANSVWCGLVDDMLPALFQFYCFTHSMCIRSKLFRNGFECVFLLFSWIFQVDVLIHVYLFINPIFLLVVCERMYMFLLSVEQSVWEVAILNPNRIQLCYYMWIFLRLDVFSHIAQGMAQQFFLHLRKTLWNGISKNLPAGWHLNALHLNGAIHSKYVL